MSLVHKNNKLLPYDIIYAAAKGDIIAIGIVLKIMKPTLLNFAQRLYMISEEMLINV